MQLRKSANDAACDASHVRGGAAARRTTPMIRRSIPRILFAAVVAMPGLSRAADPVGPAEYCATHRSEPKCVEFLGATSSYSSGSGNVGSQMSVQQNRPAQPQNSRFTLFIHAGGRPENVSSEVVGALVRQLAGAGYTVTAPDLDADKVGGPGVDYFSDQDAAAAQAVATIVNFALPPGAERLKPRPQKIRNPPGFLGVWLFHSSG